MDYKKIFRSSYWTGIVGGMAISGSTFLNSTNYTQNNSATLEPAHKVALPSPIPRYSGLKHYNNEPQRLNQDLKKLKDIIDIIEAEKNIPDNLLEITVLVESGGDPKPKDRFEPGFKRRYIEKGRFAFHKNSMQQDVFNQLKQKDPSLTKEEFKRQLATSVGPAQIMYATALDLGFKGSIEELRQPETNLEYAADLLIEKSEHTKFKLIPTITAYNTGTKKGKPKKNHLKRARYYKKQSNKKQ